MTQGIIKTSIEAKLKAALSPTYLKVVDESAKHIGHSGHRDGGESHFHIDVVSEKFNNLNMLQRHRLIYSLLAEEMVDKIHALNLKTLSPNEYNS